MPTRSAPQPTTPEPPRKPPQSSAASTPPGPDAAAPKPAEEGPLFRALVESGCDPMVAYTAEKRLHTMVSEAVAPQLQPFLAEIRRRFDQQDQRLDQHDRRFDQLDRKMDALAATGVERDRRLDVLVAQMRLLLGGLGLLVTVLIAVFGFLFTN